MVNLETIKEASRQRKLLFIRASEADGSVESREIEPYSFRYPKTGGTLLFGWDVRKHGTRSFRLERIIEVKITDKSFTPRFRVEF